MQVHTTGMDIKQILSARAVQTLGKDMTFRDFAQERPHLTRLNSLYLAFIALTRLDSS